MLLLSSQKNHINQPAHMGMNKTAAIRAAAESSVYESAVMKMDSYLSPDPALLFLLLPAAESQL